MIVWTVEGDCPACVSSIVERLNTSFPDFIFTLPEKEESTYEQPEWPDDPDDIVKIGTKMDVTYSATYIAPAEKNTTPFYSKEQIEMLQRAMDRGWVIPNLPISKEEMIRSATDFMAKFVNLKSIGRFIIEE